MTELNKPHTVRGDTDMRLIEGRAMGGPVLRTHQPANLATYDTSHTTLEEGGINLLLPNSLDNRVVLIRKMEVSYV